MRGVIAISSMVLCHCGGIAGNPDGSVDANSKWDAGIPDDAGFTNCTTPDGFGICGAKTPCPSGPDRPGCLACFGAGNVCDSCAPNDIGDGLGICLPSSPSGEACPKGDDGFVCWDPHATGPILAGLAIPYSLGVLLARYRPERLRYADLGLWTGAPLPIPTTCPMISEFQVCGPTCGGCPSGSQCVGRSPLHPYGFCIDTQADACRRDGSKKCSNAGEGCFVYNVEPSAQPLADLLGLCVPMARCTALAAKLPGGGFCVP